MARTVKCPSCGAELSVKDDKRDFMFCEYCGSKVRLDDYQETHRFVDEARIQESKDNKELEFRRMAFEEKKREEDRKHESRTLIRCTIAFAVFMVICLLGSKGYF